MKKILILAGVLLMPCIAHAQTTVPGARYGAVGGRVVTAAPTDAAYGNGLWIVTESQYIFLCYATNETGSAPQRKGDKPGKINCIKRTPDDH